MKFGFAAVMRPSLSLSLSSLLSFFLFLSLCLCARVCSAAQQNIFPNRHFLALLFGVNIQFLVASSFQVRYHLYYMHIYDPLSSSLDAHFMLSFLICHFKLCSRMIRTVFTENDKRSMAFWRTMTSLTLCVLHSMSELGQTIITMQCLSAI